MDNKKGASKSDRSHSNKRLLRIPKAWASHSIILHVWQIWTMALDKLVQRVDGPSWHMATNIWILRSRFCGLGAWDNPSDLASDCLMGRVVCKNEAVWRKMEMRTFFGGAGICNIHLQYSILLNRFWAVESVHLQEKQADSWLRNCRKLRTRRRWKRIFRNLARCLILASEDCQVDGSMAHLSGVDT